MSGITQADYVEQINTVYRQTKETVKQDTEGVTVRMATITCPCGWTRAVVKMHQCLYCKIWFCHACAELHFGKTVKQYRDEHPINNAQKDS